MQAEIYLEGLVTKGKGSQQNSGAAKGKLGVKRNVTAMEFQVCNEFWKRYYSDFQDNYKLIKLADNKQYVPRIFISNSRIQRKCNSDKMDELLGHVKIANCRHIQAASKSGTQNIPERARTLTKKHEKIKQKLSL